MSQPIQAPPARRKYVPVVGPRLSKLLFAVFGLFALLSVNAVYLVAVRVLERTSGKVYQNWFYLVMFLVHLVLGLLLVVPVVAFGIAHMRNAWNRPNRRAWRVGMGLFVTALVLLASGIVLTRIEGIVEVKDPKLRSIAYWLHVITPLVAAWLFVLHRLAGRRIKWKVGLRWAVVGGAFAAVMVLLHSQDPRRWDVVGPKSGEKYFFPSLARTATGNFIPAKVLMANEYCAQCHADVHAAWQTSVHRFSSFNNPPYLFSVRETRKVSLTRDGDLRAARWCAGCHDPVVFFSGKFDDAKFDDVNDITAHAGITCTTCHSITHVNSVRGNADFTIEEPAHYPFAFSDSGALRWVNRQLVKAKPEMHKQTFLKPLHRTAEFCSTCHKVHLQPELNHYKWLRGQNHYDAYLLSGVSGHGVQSFYYPPKATPNCAGCHMPLAPSDDFGARDFSGEGTLQVHGHQFPGANTAIPALVGMPASVLEKQRKFEEGVMRVDLFGVKEGGTIEGELTAPLRPAVPALVPGRSYLLETVVRTVKMGHLFTQGTTDSNEVWMDLRVTSGDRVIGRSGGLGSQHEVDPWAHFANVFMLDRQGNRIDRRNAQDIFVPLYNHQIPPGAADVIHYRLDLPADVDGPVTVEARLRYRKFDTTYMQYVYGKDTVNELPIVTLAEDRVTFPVAAAGKAPAAVDNPPSPIKDGWQRWNDYGIGLLRKAGPKIKGELTGAEAAFAKVEEMGRPDGPLNLARVYLAEGAVQDKAVAALQRAAKFQPAPPPWTLAWLTGLVDKQNGHLDEAIAAFQSIVDAAGPELKERGFDFSKDYNLLTELGETIFERSRLERGPERKAPREALLGRARDTYERVLTLDPENASAHYNLGLIYVQLGDRKRAQEHMALHQRYKPDDNARDRAVSIQREKNPAADHAAEVIVIYDLRRPGAFELDSPASVEPLAERYVIREGGVVRAGMPAVARGHAPFPAAPVAAASGGRP
jgi:tetratricopeptide (TPR) repeat protein